MPDGYDPETGEYVGPCPECSTDHGGADGPETMSGALACMHARAVAAGQADLADQILTSGDYLRIAQANMLGLPSELDEPIH